MKPPMSRDRAQEILKRSYEIEKGRRGERTHSMFLCNDTGDQQLCTFDHTDAASVAAGTAVLDEFLTATKARYNGYNIPVWQRPIGQQEFTVFRQGVDRLDQCEEIMLQRPMCGG